MAEPPCALSASFVDLRQCAARVHRQWCTRAWVCEPVIVCWRIGPMVVRFVLVGCDCVLVPRDREYVTVTAVARGHMVAIMIVAV